MRQNKLFSIDEFKVRLNEAKEFKESFRKKEPSKQNKLKVHLRTYTINDNRRIMYDFLKKRNLFDKVYDEKENAEVESELSKYRKRKAIEEISKKIAPVTTRNKKTKLYKASTSYLQNYLTSRK